MTWDEKLEAIVARIREPEILTGAIPGQLDIPYFTKDEVEDHLLIVSNDLLREVTEDELMAIGSDAVTALQGSTTFGIFQCVPVPLDVIAILSATINSEPAVEASASGFFQLAQVDSSLDSAYSFAEGRALFYGTSSDVIKLFVVTEASLAAWQGSTGGKPILPPGYDLEAIDRTVARLQMIDYLKPQTMYGGINNELV